MAWRWNAPVKYPKQEKKHSKLLVTDLYISSTVLIGT